MISHGFYAPVIKTELRIKHCLCVSPAAACNLFKKNSSKFNFKSAEEFCKTYAMHWSNFAVKT